MKDETKYSVEHWFWFITSVVGWLYSVAKLSNAAESGRYMDGLMWFILGVMCWISASFHWKEV